MRRLFSLALLAFALLVPQSAAADTRIIVKREPGVDTSERREVRRDAGVRFLQSLPLARTEVVTAHDGHEALRRLRSDESVVYAELDRPIRALSNDPYFKDLWGLHNTGGWSLDSPDGDPMPAVADADMDIPESWEMSTGAGRTVAVVDSGVDAGHPDLAGRVAPGYDWVERDGDASDEEGHGTHVAGTIAALEGNGAGVAGVAPDARILPLRVLDENGSGWTSDAVAAYELAAEGGVSVVNASLGGSEFSNTEYAAIDKHPETLFVVAAGNGGDDGVGDDNDDPDTAEYPCAYNLPNVLCVGASTHADEVADFSNYGAASVDLFAPGWWIWSTIPGGDYDVSFGTSMATPHVAGAAALMFARNSKLSVADVKAALLDNVDPKPAFDGISVSGGRANAAAALTGFDHDGDGLGDGEDNCPADDNAGQEDADSDGVGDACETADADPDGDGVEGSGDACPFEPAAGISDGCPGVGDDSDGDGIADAYDDCADDAGAKPHGCPTVDPGPTPPGPVPQQPPVTTSPPPVWQPPADRDGDGRADASDGCPSEAASTKDGCPLPVVESLRAKRRGKTLTITIRADRAATMRVTVQRRKGRRWVRVTRKTVATESGRAKIKVRRARKGRYRAVVKLSSSAGSAKARRYGFRVR